MKCLFALSADYGEFATANLLSRGQPFERRFALPRALAARAAGLDGAAFYGSAGELGELIEREAPDAVVLASGYLYAINGLFDPEQLAALLARLRARRIAVATTDPWLRLFAAAPATRFAIHSVKQGGIDEAQSAKVLALQRRLEAVLAGVPHLVAVPAPLAQGCYNPAFRRAPRPAPDADEWLFVLAQQDLALASEGFLEALQARAAGLLRRGRNRLRFVGPPALGAFLAERFPGESRVEYLAFAGFAAFEEALLRAKVVAYWNAISASALYCLYHGVAPVFFGRGHQARVVPGLYEHAVRHVYGGEAPALIDAGAELEADADALIARRDLYSWLDRIREGYARLPETSRVLEALCNR